MPSASVELEEPPEALSNRYVTGMPPVLLTNLQRFEETLRTEALIQRANLRFQRRSFTRRTTCPRARRIRCRHRPDARGVRAGPGDRQEFDRKLDEMVDAIHRYDLAGLGASAAVEEGRFDKAPLEDILEMTFPVDPRLKDKVREQVAATVSQLPLSVNNAVLGYINYFSNHGHKTIVSAIQRSGRYRPMIQRILDEEGVPQELIHLAQAESGFYPARDVQHGRRRHVAVRQVPRQ